jgi:hypothetical protein
MYKPTSDLDLCIMGDDRLPAPLLERLRTAFSDSTLPMRVDVVEGVSVIGAQARNAPVADSIQIGQKLHNRRNA